MKCIILTILFLTSQFAHAESCAKAQYRSYSNLDSNSDGIVLPIESTNSLNALLSTMNSISRRSPAIPTADEKTRYDVNSDGYVDNLDYLNMVNLNSLLKSYDASVSRYGLKAVGSGFAGTCPISKLRAFSRMDKSKKHNPQSSGYYGWAVFYMAYYLMTGYEYNDVSANDYNLDDRVDSLDIEDLSGAYNQR